jgi:hypothetical protein
MDPLGYVTRQTEQASKTLYRQMVSKENNFLLILDHYQKSLEPQPIQM